MLKIEGMSCAHCIQAVTRALQGQDGVEVEQVEIGSAVVRYDAARIRPDRLVHAVEGEGHTVLGQEHTP
jgi:copper chaperone